MGNSEDGSCNAEPQYLPVIYSFTLMKDGKPFITTGIVS